MKQLILLFVLLIPVAFALDCGNVADKESCNYVLNSGISADDQNYLVSDLSYGTSNSPDFNLVYQWNTAIDTSKPPQNTKMYSTKLYIKNAWVKSLAVMPSVIEDNTLLVSGKGNILNSYGYAIEIPKTPYVTDCKTNYKLLSQNAEVKNYVNNVYQASGKLVNYQSSDASQTFTSQLNVEAQVSIDHYKLRKYCCSRGKDGSCQRYCTVCEYKSTEVKKDSLSISDSITAQKEKQLGSFEFNVLNRYNDNTKIEFNFSKTSAFEILFSSSNLKATSYHYVPNFSTSYSIMTLTAIPYNQFSYNNLLFTNNNTFLVKDSSGCKIILHSHFNQSIYKCNLTYNSVKISIDTDKFSYSANDTIKVILSPNNVEMKVTYANITKSAIGSVEFAVVSPQNRIVVQYGDSYTEKIIFFKAQDQWDSFFQIGTFAGANWLLMILVRKYKPNIL